MDENKQKLIIALEKEQKMLMSKHNNDGIDHQKAIDYLKTNKYDSSDLEKYEILCACVEDLETIMSDYNV